MCLLLLYLLIHIYICWLCIYNYCYVTYFSVGFLNLYVTLRCTVLTATLFPGTCFAVFFFLDVLVWSYGSTGAVPILSMFAVLTLWFGISVPLVFLGAFFGYKEEVVTFPVKTSNIPRQIPTQPWYMAAPVVALAGGILPFGACFVELFFIMSSIWMDQYYYVFGFLLLVYVILGVTCAEISIVLCYFQLCAEDYNWWWRSVLSAGQALCFLDNIKSLLLSVFIILLHSIFNVGSTALYVFLYSAVYFFRLEGNMFVTYCLYFGYMAIISLGIFLLTGTLRKNFFLCFSSLLLVLLLNFLLTSTSILLTNHPIYVFFRYCRVPLMLFLQLRHIRFDQG